MNFIPILPVVPYEVLPAAQAKWYRDRPSTYRLTLVGLGDVGGTLAQALCTLGSSCIEELVLFDLDENRLERYHLELNQICGPYVKPLKVTTCSAMEIFKADLVIFTASKAVPPVGTQGIDVRMVQLESNAQLVRNLVRDGVASGFSGLYAIVSDPVDLLCQVARDALVHYGQGESASIRVKGFGLGVMNARAHYYAKAAGMVEYGQEGRVYGPHGKDLVVINSIKDNFDQAKSKRLTEAVVGANLQVRALGFKPYIAPAISSAAYAIKACLEGEWHYSTIPYGQQYLGCLNCFSNEGPRYETLPNHPVQRQMINDALEAMRIDYEKLPPIE